MLLRVSVIFLEPKILTVRANAPVGWLISDLVEDGYATQSDRCSLYSSNQTLHFQIIANRLHTKNSIKHLSGHSVAIPVQATVPQRIFVVNVDIIGTPSSRFSMDIYSTSITDDLSPNTIIPFKNDITFINAMKSADLHLSIISNSTNLPFVLEQKIRQNNHYVQLYLSRQLKQTDGTLQSFYIGALDKHNLIRIAVARIDVRLEKASSSAPKFDTVHYFKQVDKLPPQTTVLRVTARASKGAVVYRIEPESVPFDVTPFSGDIFSRYGVPNGRYLFAVIATDSRAQEARANVRIVVGQRLDPKRLLRRPNFFKSPATTRNPVVFHNVNQFKRNKRDLGSDVVLTLKEDHPLGFLGKKLSLNVGENVLFAPVTTDYLRIHGNGSIELIKPLNYEFEMFHRAAVQISGQFKG